MKNVYIARQPIMDKEGEIFAYELLYRDVEQTSSFDNHRYATSAVINNILNKFGTKALLGERKAFVKIDRKFLLNDLIFSIPKEFFIFTLLDSIEMDEYVLERLEQLKAKGYELALNDTLEMLVSMEQYRGAFSYLDYIKINIPANLENAHLESMIKECKTRGITILATRIESEEHKELAQKMGCSYFQGYFFAKPKIIENKKLDASQLSIIHLYNLLMEDTNIDEITQEFEKNYAISVQLLQFINSGAFSFRKRISSIHHVLVLVGRVPLAQWLMLMIYSKSVAKQEESSPLLLMIKSRTELMQGLLRLIDPNVRSNKLGEAYFTGVISLIDVIFGMQIEEILEHLHVSDEVRDALLKGEGVLGEIYTLISQIEQFQTEPIKDFAQKYQLDPEEITTVIAQSIEDVNQFENKGE